MLFYSCLNNTKQIYTVSSLYNSITCAVSSKLSFNNDNIIFRDVIHMTQSLKVIKSQNSFLIYLFYVFFWITY